MAAASLEQSRVSPVFHGRVEVDRMEYRGKHYTIVQGIGSNSWKWTVHLDEKTAMTGEATSREAAMTSVVWTIDKALAPK